MSVPELTRRAFLAGFAAVVVPLRSRPPRKKLRSGFGGGGFGLNPFGG